MIMPAESDGGKAIPQGTGEKVQGVV